MRNATLTYVQIIPEEIPPVRMTNNLQSLLSDLFRHDAAAAYECHLRRVTLCWLRPSFADGGRVSVKADQLIANSINMLSKFLNELWLLKLSDQVDTTDLQMLIWIDKFYRNNEFYYTDQVLNEALSAWRNPEEHIVLIPTIEAIARFTATMNDLSQLIARLEMTHQSNNTLNSKGGMSC